MSHDTPLRRNLESLKKEAKRWLAAIRADDADARGRLERAVPGAKGSPGLRDVLSTRRAMEPMRRFLDDRAGAATRHSVQTRAVLVDHLQVVHSKRLMSPTPLRRPNRSDLLCGGVATSVVQRSPEPLRSSPSTHQSAGWSGARQPHPARSIAGMLLGLHATAAQEVHGPARYTGAGASGRHPRPRKGLRPPRHRSRHRQDDLFSCPGERTTGAYGCAVGTAGRGARHDRSPDSPAHSRDAREPRYRSTETTGQGAAGGVSRAVTRRGHRGRPPTIAPRRRRPSRCTTRSSCWRARTGSRAGRS